MKSAASRWIIGQNTGIDNETSRHSSPDWNRITGIVEFVEVVEGCDSLLISVGIEKAYQPPAFPFRWGACLKRRITGVGSGCCREDFSCDIADPVSVDG